jgi:hypothetical protein
VSYDAGRERGPPAREIFSGEVAVPRFWPMLVGPPAVCVRRLNVSLEDIPMENPQPLNPETPRTRRPAWRTAIAAGVIASIVFQVLEVLLIPRFGGGSPWGPARMIAAIVMGRGVLPPPATFELSIVLVALAVDIVLAVIYTAVLGWFIHYWSLGWSLMVGAVFGVLLYIVNFYGFTAVFPWFEMGRNGVTLFTHVVFSLTAAWAYKKFSARSS